MRKMLIFPALLLVILSFGADVQAQQNSKYVEHQVIVKMSEKIQAADIVSMRENLNASVLKKLWIVDAELWETPGITVEDAIYQYRNDPRIEYIEPNYRVWAVETIPNDSSFSQLWGLHNTGQTGGTSDADINAVDAWDIQTGTDVLIGVIDTGVDWTHEELADNIWTNPGEIPDNGIDDDGNGYIDDVRGWDFVNKDNDPMDDNGHGTHVAGTIAAVGNNGIGVVGVSWSAQIMPLKFLGADGSGITSDAILAIEYAMMMSAKLTNNSWGSSGFSQALYNAIAVSGNANILFIAAAGNGGDDNIGDDNDQDPHYPSSYDLDNIISVASTNHNDAKSSFSNFGFTSVDLGAPGSSILSTVPGDTYSFLSGTSMATPHVSGAAALIWAQYPDLTNLQVKNRIVSTVDPIPALDGRSVTGGRLNAFVALAEPDSIPPAAVTDLAAADPTSNSITLTWTASGDDSAFGTSAYYDIRYATSPIDSGNFDLATEVLNEPDPQETGSLETFTTGGLGFNTTYYFALRVFDEQGNGSKVSNSPSAATLGKPDISVTPDSLSDSLLTASTSTQILTIYNVGEGTLDFTFPDFASAALLNTPGIERNDVSSRFEHLGLEKGLTDLREGNPLILGAGGPDGFGYRWIDSDEPGGPIFNWIEISKVGTPILLLDDDVEEVTLPFTFPFYGEAKTTLKISSNGYLTFGADGTDFSNDPIPDPVDPNDLIAPFWDDLNPSADDTIFYYHDTDQNRFIVQYTGLPHYSAGGPYTFQVILYTDGSMLFQYLDMLPPLDSATIGVENRDASDGLQVALNTDFIHDSLAVSVSAIPQWLSLNPVSGTVLPGSSVDIAVNFDATGLNGGNYDAHIVIASNDPDEPQVRVPAHLHVTGVPDIAVSADTLDYGFALIGASVDDTLIVSNIGTDTLTVSSIASDNPNYTVDLTGLRLAPGESQEALVSFAPVDTGISSGTLTITSDVPDAPMVTVTLTGEGLIAPNISVSPDSLSADLRTGETSTQLLTIKNTGGSDLNLDISIEGVAAASVSVEVRSRSFERRLTIQLQDNPQKEWSDYRQIRQVKTAMKKLPLEQDALRMSLPVVIEDPVGDGGVVDVTVLRGASTSNELQIEMEFNTEIDPFEFGGFLSLDVDQNPSTGLPPSFGIAGQDIGAEYEFRFFTVSSGFVGLYDVISGFVGAYPVEVGIYTLRFSAPLSDIGNDDGNMDVTGAIGDVFGPTDWLPDAGHGTISGVSWLSVTPTMDTVPASSSVDVGVAFDAAHLNGGDYDAHIVIASNDPDEPEVRVPAYLHVRENSSPGSFTRLLPADSSLVLAQAVIFRWTAAPDVDTIIYSLSISVNRIDMTFTIEDTTLTIDFQTFGLPNDRLPVTWSVLASDGILTSSPTNGDGHFTLNNLFLFGDPSGNGSITAFDATLVLRHSVGLFTLAGSAAVASDVSGNGLISAFDASSILQYVVGLIDCFPVDPGCGTPLAKRTSVRGTLGWSDVRSVDLSELVSLPILWSGEVGRVTSAQLTVHIDPMQAAVEKVVAHVPQDWQLVYSVGDSALYVAMAGVTPISVGELVTITVQVHDPVAQVTLHGTGFVNESVTGTRRGDDRSGADRIRAGAKLPKPIQPHHTDYVSVARGFGGTPGHLRPVVSKGPDSGEHPTGTRVL